MLWSLLSLRLSVRARRSNIELSHQSCNNACNTYTHVHFMYAERQIHVNMFRKLDIHDDRRPIFGGGAATAASAVDVVIFVCVRFGKKEGWKQ